MSPVSDPPLFPHGEASRQERILRARARVLAEKPIERTANKAGHEVVEFFLGSEKYAIETRFVQEFFLAGAILPIPCTPPFILGVVSRRGRILSVLDLGGFLPGTVPHVTPKDKYTPLVVLRHEGMELALAVDRVGVVNHVTEEHLTSRNEAVPAALAPYVMGLTPEPMTILNAATLLSEPTLKVSD
ncbi:MAG TPA: chemotaxis protein CheW [Candidatus Sumerlaeota bacterium]|nr:chemotaxis protein CheW [Candidatus Sumerlaeota bacterium]HPS00444.1 chemotaxis protein CheW [Candidatus Sumerlaeota bacterium]